MRSFASPLLEILATSMPHPASRCIDWKRMSSPHVTFGSMNCRWATNRSFTFFVLFSVSSRGFGQWVRGRSRFIKKLFVLLRACSGAFQVFFTLLHKLSNTPLHKQTWLSTMQEWGEEKNHHQRIERTLLGWHAIGKSFILSRWTNCQRECEHDSAKAHTNGFDSHAEGSTTTTTETTERCSARILPELTRTPADYLPGRNHGTVVWNAKYTWSSVSKSENMTILCSLRLLHM